MAKLRKRRLTSFQIIILGFAAVILLGALLLMLPISSRERVVTPFRESLFTAVSACCVTGLVVQDTATYWSIFGQVVLLVLIQIGGMGVVTVAVTFVRLSGKRISLMQRSTMQEAIAAPQTGGIVRLTGFILKATFCFELLGTVLLLPVFCPKFGVKGIWLSLFHAVSAFCNAGFDILGTPDAKFSSLTAYAANPLLNIVLMLLIVVGGIGFLTWDDIRTNRFRVRRYRMQSKVVLVTTGVPLLVPAVCFFFGSFAELPLGERVLASLFQSVTPRTAGFNTADLNAMTGAGRGLIAALMLIGGSPGSTAGGMKTTTLALLFANAIAVFRRKEDAQLFGRRADGDAVKNAATILILYLTLFFGGALAISAIEGLPLGSCLFETASAVGTAGPTLGLTPQLGAASQYILMALMFIGRVGGLTLVYAAFSGGKAPLSRLPQEKLAVG